MGYDVRTLSNKYTKDGWGKSSFTVFVFNASFENSKDILINVNDEFKTNKNLKYFTMPSQKRIDILRNLIAPKVLNFYPQFAKNCGLTSFLKSFPISEITSGTKYNYSTNP